MLPIIVINLNKAENRKINLKNQFDKLNISDYFFLPAFDAKYITNLTIRAYIGMGYGAGRNFRNAELAIIMSHLAAIKYAQMMKLSNIIILEDDIILCEDWHNRIKILQDKLPTDWEYVYLSGHSDYVTFKRYEEPTLISSPKMVGAFSYMVNESAYQKISDFCMSFMTTFDDMIMHMINQGKLKSFTYFPFMTFHDAIDSFVWDKTPEHLTHNNNMHSSYSYFKNKI